MNEEELKNIFLSEAFEQKEELERLFTTWEQDVNNLQIVQAIFRLLHTLKANAASMGYDSIAEFAHAMEDIFGLFKNQEKQQSIDTHTFDALFRANDKLGELIQNVKENTKTSYKGLLTKIKVLFRNLQEQENEPPKQNNESNVKTNTEEEIIVENEVTEINPEVQNQDIEETETAPVVFSDTIQVPLQKLDSILDLVGELTIEKDKMDLLIPEIDTERQVDLKRLQQITADLQYSVMDVRLVKMGILFQKFHRIVRDVAQAENKEVKLKIKGTEVEIDRSILQIIGDSLIHLVRNAVSHGIENNEDRRERNKPVPATILLKAYNKVNQVIIEVQDDGKGIDTERIKQVLIEGKRFSASQLENLNQEEVLKQIFESGFSSANKITNISGRGVGLDVVKKALDKVGGKITIDTQINQGTTFTLYLPISMAVKEVLLFDLKSQTYAIPVAHTQGVVSIQKAQIHQVGEGLVADYLGKNISLVFLEDLFAASSLEELEKEKHFQKGLYKLDKQDTLFTIVVSNGDNNLGIVVDKLQTQKEIIEKQLKAPLSNAPFMSGATILGNGSVCLVLDIYAIIDFFFNSKK